MKRFVFLLCLLIAFVCTVHAQNSFSLRYFGLTIHPFGDQTSQLQPYKLDQKAYVVANFGGFAVYDHYLFYDQIAITGMQGFFTDCSAGFAGYTHIGIRGLLLEKGKHRLMADIGPVLYYRRDWNRFPEYVDGGVFHRYHSKNFGDLQYKLFLIAGEFSWNWQLSEELDFNAGFTPGLPLALAFSAGITWWPKRFETKFVQPRIYLRKKK